MKNDKKLGIYVHLPFCKKKCDYCDFYSVSGEDSTQMEEYQQALLAHFALLSPSASGYQVDTVYFGGGTPTLYGGGRIALLLKALRKHFRLERQAEITVEGNPESVDKKNIQALKRAGVNRISLGIQSTKAEELSQVGRIHSPQDSREAVAVLKNAQMNNISLDLIYGLPHQTEESWADTLEEAIALEPQHISCYGLKVEEGTALSTRVAQGEDLPSEDIQGEMYLWTVERLAQAGFVQYEISNFAQRGLASKHKLGYWMGKPYLGFGASAASDFGGYRSTIGASITEYCHCVLGEGKNIFSSHELMSLQERKQEYLMLRLRTAQGIVPQQYEKVCQLDFSPLAERFQRYAQEGWAFLGKEGQWRLSPEGFLRSNLIIGDLMEIQEESGLPLPPPILPVVAEQEIMVKKEEENGIPLAEESNGQFRLW